MGWDARPFPDHGVSHWVVLFKKNIFIYSCLIYCLLVLSLFNFDFSESA